MNKIVNSSEPVVGWRLRRLRAVGLPSATARAVASDFGYDLHALFGLVDRGCPPELAVRIVAPLDDGVAT